MAESLTRNFVSQWTYDQDREDVGDETTMQWLGVDRVAELVRHREESHLEDDLDTMNFEARAAALEAHFFQPARHESPASDRTPLSPARNVTRIRPQSASLSRRAAENNVGSTANKRTRPQSAKTRAEISNATQTENQVGWKAPAQQKPSKWREMLARGPEFKQLTLRRLELETYELLYNTLQQQQVMEPKTTTRRRKRPSSGSGASRPQGNSPALACGSGLHLARSRKQRQQEHDRQMMLRKGRQSSRPNEQDRASVTQGTRAIQDKTRKRSKLLKNKKSQKQLPGESFNLNQDSKQEKQQKDATLQRQASGHRTMRGPWIPAGSASSLAIRGISSDANEVQVTQEKRAEQVIEAFRSHAYTHQRLLRHAQKQLKKARQSANTSRETTNQKMQQIATESKNHVRPQSASSRIVAETSSRSSNSDHCSNQENDTYTTDIAIRPRLTSGSEPLHNEPSDTLTLVIPPLKLPPHLWEDQDAHETHNEPCQDSNCILQSDVLGTADRGQLREQSPPPSEPALVSANLNAVNMAMKFELQAIWNKPRTPAQEMDCRLRFCDSTKQNAETEGRESNAGCFEVVQLSGARLDSSHEEQNSVRRQSTVEDGYLVEGLMEHASTGVSTGTAEPSPVGLLLQLPATDAMQLASGEDAKNELSENDTTILTTARVLKDIVQICGEVAHSASVLPVLVELSMSLSPATDAQLPVELIAAQYRTPENEDSTKESTSLDLDGMEAGKFGENVEIGPSANLFGEPATNACEVDTSSMPMLPVPDNEQNDSPLVVPVFPVEVVDGAEDIISKSLSMNLPDDTRGCETNLSTKFSETRHGHSNTKHSNMSIPTDLVSSLLYESPSVKIEEPTGRGVDPDFTTDRTEFTQPTASGAADKLDPGDSVTNVLSAEDDQPSSDNGDHQEAEQENAASSNPLPSCSITLEMVTAATTSQPTNIPTSEDEEKTPAVDVKTDHAPTNPIDFGAKSQPRSPKKKTRQSKATASGKSSTPKKKKKSTDPSQDAVNSEQVLATTSLPTQRSSRESHDGNSDQSEEGPLRSHKQLVTRSFLTRVASGKTIAPESLSTHPQSSNEQVDHDYTFGFTDSTSAKVVAVVVDTEPQLARSDIKDNEGDSASPLERERSQALNDCESTVGKCPRTTEESVTTTESLDMATDFARTDASTFASAVTNSDEAEPSSPANGEQNPSAQEPQPTTVNNASPHNYDTHDREELMQPPVEHHNAARKIQAQYRCFVRRRLILDQLRFMMAKQRREARRKLRQKGKKVSAEDTVASVSESPTSAVGDVSSVDRPPKEVQQVAPTLVSSEISIAMSPEASSNEAPGPSDKDAKLAARKDSCEYAFDLFDDSTYADGEGVQEAVVEAVKDPSVVEIPTCTIESGSQRPVVQEDSAPLLEKNVEVAISVHAAARSERLQGEVRAQQDPTLLPEVKQVDALPTAGARFLSSTMLAELAFSEDPEEEPAKDVVVGATTKKQSNWERYVDSSTSKSYYFNLSTNETLWTAPEDRDAAANFIGATPTTTRTADVEVSASADTWQEFLDEASGQLYYYNSKTGECSWEPPAARTDPPGVVALPESVATAESAACTSAWIMYIDPASQAPYYVNVETLATSWERPDNFATQATEPIASREDTYIIALDDHASVDPEVG